MCKAVLNKYYWHTGLFLTLGYQNDNVELFRSLIKSGLLAAGKASFIDARSAEISESESERNKLKVVDLSLISLKKFIG